MPDALEQVLAMVADGRLTPDEGARLIAALDAAPADGGERVPPKPDTPRPPEPDRPRTGRTGDAIRIEVTDRGRNVVNLRVPLALGRGAVARIPGLSEAVSDRIREALATGVSGPILEIDDDGDGVRVVIE